MYFEFQEHPNEPLHLCKMSFFKGLITLIAILLKGHDLYVLRYVPKSRIHFY